MRPDFSNLTLDLAAKQEAAAAEAKRTAVASGELVFLGVNKHPNKEERLGAEVQRLTPGVLQDGGKDFDFIPRFRATGRLDRQRLNEEKSIETNA